jgi:hypothetical protein
LQTEQCAAIVEKIEFYIAAATIQLELFLLFAVCVVTATLNYGYIGSEEVIPN